MMNMKLSPIFDHDFRRRGQEYINSRALPSGSDETSFEDALSATRKAIKTYVDAVIISLRASIEENPSITPIANTAIPSMRVIIDATEQILIHLISEGVSS